jgi:hypothetical protein
LSDFSTWARSSLLTLSRSSSAVFTADFARVMAALALPGSKGASVSRRICLAAATLPSACANVGSRRKASSIRAGDTAAIAGASPGDGSPSLSSST